MSEINLIIVRNLLNCYGYYQHTIIIMRFTMIRSNKDSDFEKLKSTIFNMADTVENMMDKVEHILLKKDSSDIDVIKDKEEKVDNLDIKIDQLVMRMLALYEPKAKELRIITTALGVARDLERMSDLLYDISKEACNMIKVNPDQNYKKLPIMLEKTKYMLKNTLTSYFEQDTEKALEIIKLDDEVDELNEAIIKKAAKNFGTELSRNSYYISLIYVSRSLERIADLSTNIAEQTYFINQSELIRHQV